MKDRKETIHLIVALGLVAAIIVLALNTKAPDVNISSQPGELRNTISVSGTGKVTVEPDEAEIYVNIITEAEDAKGCQQENANIAENVRNALKREGVKDDDIETYRYQLYPKTSYDRETGESEIYGYKLTHTLKITTKDIDNTGELVDAAIGAGANGLDRVNFGLSDELRDKAYKDALEEAAGNAEGKADSMADALGVKLGEIISVSESGVSYVPYSYPMAEMAVGEARAAPTVISPQDIEVNAYISVVHEIE